MERCSVCGALMHLENRTVTLGRGPRTKTVEGVPTWVCRCGATRCDDATQEKLDRWEQELPPPPSPPALGEDSEWAALVQFAHGSELVAPAPGPLFDRLQEFCRAFAAAEGGWPQLADLPGPVQLFFGQLALVSHVTRPCAAERVTASAYRAWRHELFSRGHGDNLAAAQMAKEMGIPYNGRMLAHESPSEAALGDIADAAKIGVELARKLIHRKV